MSNSRHKITKVRCEGGVIMELVQEYQQNTGTLRNQMMSINDHGIVSLKSGELVTTETGIANPRNHKTLLADRNLNPYGM
jgi:hypothetical protein